MAVFPELERLSLQDLQALFSSRTPYEFDLRERSLWLQEIATKIARHGREGLSFLIDKIPGSDYSKLRAIVLSFSFLPQEAAKERLEELKRILLGLLDNKDP